MTRITAIVDENGHVLAAQLGDRAADEGDEEIPSAELLPSRGQRVVEMEVPDELDRLPGSDLTRFFAQVEVSWPATVKIPAVDVVRRRHESAEE